VVDLYTACPEEAAGMAAIGSTATTVGVRIGVREGAIEENESVFGPLPVEVLAHPLSSEASTFGLVVVSHPSAQGELITRKVPVGTIGLLDVSLIFRSEETDTVALVDDQDAQGIGRRIR